MTGSWRAHLRADPTPWLLEAENPAARYLTLRHVLDRPPGDPEVVAAQAATPAYPPVAELLAAQGSGGHWGKRDYYLPRASRGTFWVLSVLGDLGLTAEEEQIRQACEWMFTHQRENGSFGRRRRVQGKGIVWDEDPGPCTDARIVRFLIQLGYGDDPRVRSAINWLLSIQRDDDMWFCRGAEGRGCLRATLDLLRLAALHPQTAAQPGVKQAAAAVCSLLMEPRMSRYHVGEAWGTWEYLKYPTFGINVISALDALARLGYTPKEPKIAAAVKYLLSRQLRDGSWPLDDTWSQSPIDFGPPGEPNKWVTLEALTALKLLLGTGTG